MAATIQREMAGHKRVALVAHDNMKQALVDWVKVRSEELKLHHLYATGTTGTRLSKKLVCRSLVCCQGLWVAINN